MRPPLALLAAAVLLALPAFGFAADTGGADHSGGVGSPVDWDPDLAWFTLAVFIALVAGYVF